jgi:hypothetical protein
LDTKNTIEHHYNTLLDKHEEPFKRDQFWKRCSRAGASVRKSVAKVRKMLLAELFPPISQNSSSSSTASSK